MQYKLKTYNVMSDVYVYIARDKDGELNLFSHKPHRCTDPGWNNEAWDSPNMPEEGESEYINTLEYIRIVLA